MSGSDYLTHVGLRITRRPSSTVFENAGTVTFCVQSLVEEERRVFFLSRISKSFSGPSSCGFS